MALIIYRQMRGRPNSGFDLRLAQRRCEDLSSPFLKYFEQTQATDFLSDSLKIRRQWKTLEWITLVAIVAEQKPCARSCSRMCVAILRPRACRLRDGDVPARVLLPGSVHDNETRRRRGRESSGENWHRRRPGGNRFAPPAPGRPGPELHRLSKRTSLYACT